MNKLLCTIAVIIGLSTNMAIASSTSTVFPPENPSECNDDTALTWNGSGNVKCEKVIKVSPTIGSPLYGFSVEVKSAAGMEKSIEDFIKWSLPQPLTGNNVAVADAFRSECLIDDAKNGTELIAIGNSPTCRNIVCSNADPMRRWPINTSLTGMCSEGYVWSACSSGQMLIRIGCMFTSDDSNLKTIP